MADKNFVLRLELENGQYVVRGLEDIGAKGDAAMKRVGRAAQVEASTGLRVLGTATDEARHKIDEFANRLGPLGRILTQFGPNGLYIAAAAGGFAFLAVKVGQAVRSTINDMDQLADTAQRLKVNVETLQALRLSARESGFEMGDADGAIQSLRDARLNAISGQRGSERALRAFGALGISEDELRRLEDMDALLQRVSDGAREMGDQGQAAANLFKLGLDSIAAALLTADNGLAGFVQGSKEAGKVIDEELVKRAADVNDQWELMATKLNVAVTPALTRLGEIATPVLEGVAELLSAALINIEGIVKAVAWLASNQPSFVADAQAKAARDAAPLGVSGSRLLPGGSVSGPIVSGSPLLPGGGPSPGFITPKALGFDLSGTDFVDPPAKLRETAAAQREVAAATEAVTKAQSDSVTAWDAGQRGAEAYLETLKAADYAAIGAAGSLGLLDQAVSRQINSWDDLLFALLDVVAQFAKIAAMQSAQGGGSFFDILGQLFSGAVGIGLGGGGSQSGSVSYSGPTSQYGGGRAGGGPVHRGMGYWTGERGPEPFFPAVDGRILSVEQAQAAMRGAGGTTVVAMKPEIVIRNEGAPVTAETREGTGRNGNPRWEVILKPAVDGIVKSGHREGRYDSAQRSRTGITPRLAPVV